MSLPVYDNSASNSGSGDRVFAYTAAAGAGVVIGIFLNTSGTYTWNSVTYNGNALTFISEHKENSRTIRSYYLENAGDGSSHDFSIDTTYTGMIHVHVVSVTGYLSGDMVGVTAMDSAADSDTPSLTVTLEAANSLTFQAVAYNSTGDTISPNDGQDLRTSISSTFRSYGYTNDSPTTAGNTTQDYTTGDVNDWYMLIVEIKGATTSPQTVTASGIASAEAFGTATLTNLATISPSAIASAEAFGTASLTRGAVSVTITAGISGAEAFGTATVQRGAVSVSPSGIASTETIGTASVQPGSMTITVTAIDTSETLGAVTVTNNANIQCTGILTEEIFGAIDVDQTTTIPAIDTAEAFGAVSVQSIINVTAIDTAEAFGTAELLPGNVNITASGIVSDEQFGEVSVIPLTDDIYPGAIQSAAAFGVAVLTPGNVNTEPTAIDTSEAFGVPEIILGTVALVVTAIDTAETFGDAAVTSAATITALGIASGEIFYGVLIYTHPVFIDVTAIDTAEAVGTPDISNIETVFADSILSDETFGELQLNQTITAVGTASGETFGDVLVIYGQSIADVGGIASAETFGSVAVQWSQIIIVGGIGTGEALGGPLVFPVTRNALGTQFENDLTDIFMNADEFAEPILYQYANGETITFNAIFDNEYLAVDPDTRVGVMAHDPVLWVKTSIFGNKELQKGDLAQVRGAWYQVMTNEPDGTGLSSLTLHKRKTV